MKKIALMLLVAAMTMVGCKKADCTNSPASQNKSFMELARQRYAVREYAQTPVEQAKLDSILEAGRLAPTGRNVQPQHILKESL